MLSAGLVIKESQILPADGEYIPKCMTHIHIA